VLAVTEGQRKRPTGVVVDLSPAAAPLIQHLMETTLADAPLNRVGRDRRIAAAGRGRRRLDSSKSGGPAHCAEWRPQRSAPLLGPFLIQIDSQLVQ
jgi:hypothetical protein